MTLVHRYVYVKPLAEWDKWVLTNFDHLTTTDQRRTSPQMSLLTIECISRLIGPVRLISTLYHGTHARHLL